MKDMKRNLKKGTFPTIWKKSSQTLSKRSRRSLLNEILAGQTTNEDTEEEDNPEEEVISLKGSSAPEESADTMGAPNLNPEESPEVEGVLNTSQGSLLEVNPEKEGCIPETETGEISVDAEMASEVLGTPGDKTALESQGISGTDEVTETMQILEAQGIEKVQDMDEVMQIDESLTIPELEQVSMDTPTGHAGNCTTCKTLRSEVTQLRGKVTRLKSKLISNQDQWVETFKSIQEPKQLLMVNAAIQTDPWPVTNETELGLEDESEDEQEMQDDAYEEFECDEDPTWSPEEIEDAYKKLKEDDDSVKTHQNPRLDLQGKNIREEPKGIVFLSKLLLLFQFCHLCFFSKPKLSVSQTGTLLTVESFCRNCSQTKVWKSQPDLLGKFPAGNLLLSFAVLCEPSEKKETIH
ncbi:unnamed protein product [Porites evermanni]|uniref:Uncharacterized protein n=1 Tax=Porites evermanni TaxID=104178 RepID=A0ABN8SZJ5_9CNID|nr:unnamed protein product [Porites evermanni]